MSKNIKNLIIIILGLGIVVAVLATNKALEYHYGDGEVMVRKTYHELGISFEYRTEPDGYTLIENEILSGESKELIKSFNLMETEQYEGYLDSVAKNIPTEGPPSISIRIFENKENLTSENWIEAYAQDANYDMALKPIEEFSLGGVPAVGYTIDGLYVTRVIVISNNYKIYVIDDSFIDPAFNKNKSIDSEKFLESLSFF